MSVTFNPAESFHEQFNFHNSPEAIRCFPFPFPEDHYAYTVNLEPTTSGAPGSVFEHWFDVDEHYLSEVAERARVLEKDPNRCIVSPHMQTACWDALELIMTRLAADYPAHFQLQRDGAHWHWRNLALDIEQRFIFGDAATLPHGPLEYITRQMQGDFALIDQRDDNLFMDAGMDFKQWHAPVPAVAHQTGVFDRALKFMLNMQVDRPVRRLNWTMTVNPRLDTSSETYHEWGKDRGTVTPENIGALLHLRVELQVLFRLPRSNALMLSLHTYLISLDELVTQPAWATRLYRVLRDLPEAIANYKGLSRYRQTALDYLRPFDPEA
jgi:hypothetical protein